jgi:hypothetical protein
VLLFLLRPSELQHPIFKSDPPIALDTRPRTQFGQLMDLAVDNNERFIVDVLVYDLLEKI